MMQDLVAQVANVGFPIAVSIYLLVRLEAKMESLTASIYELAKVIEGIRDSGKTYS
ncbi:MAG: YvrJ family protein [Tepidanaerobacteraceae bacterium]